MVKVLGSVMRLLLLSVIVFGLPSMMAGEDLPQSVTIAGTIQRVLGCPGDWQPDCEATQLIYNEADDLWNARFDLPAGSYEYKAALNGSWDLNYGANAEQNGANISLVLEADTTVEFLYSHKTNWVTDSVNATIANVPGNYQTHIGCPGDWQPSCLRSWLQDPDGDGIYTFSTSAIPAGSYEAKVALNRSWGENYGDGGARDGANIPFTVIDDGSLTEFVWDSDSKIMTITVGGVDTSRLVGNLFMAKAHWVTADTIAWNIPRIPGAVYQLHYAPQGGLVLGEGKVEGGDAIVVTYDREGMTDEIRSKFPHLRDFFALRISQDDLALVPDILKGQIAISATDNQGNLLNATSIQIPGVLDDLYTYDGPLGLAITDGVPGLHVWAPTARSVRLHLFEDSAPDTTSTVYDMALDADYGVWSITGEADWLNKFYLYEIEVYVPSTGQVENNLVTDPYAYSLSLNSTRSQIVDLNDESLMPDGWLDYEKPPLASPSDIVIYELHVRDFSVRDETVPEADRGTFRAFTHLDSNGMQHLRALAEAGLTHIHLLPVFDIATINEDKSQWQDVDWEQLTSLPPDSEEQQAAVSAIAAEDGFNWGYDPYHFTVPEGSYSTEPDGSARIREFREMVQALNSIGLRVVMDVVYNHTNASGQSEKSVFDRIVPGYYHRLSLDGRVETSTCCQNTATEHNMMERFMLDSLHTWATAYKVDGFRFDLMGHHMVSNMVRVREMLDALTLDTDGVDGAGIYVYGEGWNFGEVANNARGRNATQINMAGTGIGTFNDRLRDAVRGGGPFSPRQIQGFITGLYYEPNTAEQGIADSLALLLHHADQIRVGLAGNLRDFSFENADGETVTGADVDYNGSPAGYTLSPQENIVYISAHDNETLFDAIQLKAAPEAGVEDRVRMNNVGLSIVALSQGIPFFHAGDDMLRSKSLDRDSYNSGDWFNVLDFTYSHNNFGVGLPVADKNENDWDIMRPILANPNLQASQEDILKAVMHLREMLQIRRSSPLFRLQTAAEIQANLRFLNTGPDQTPGLIVMVLSDNEGIDPEHSMIVVLFNAANEDISFQADELAEMAFSLHPVQAESHDPIVRGASYEDDGTFVIPARTTAVFAVND